VIEEITNPHSSISIYQKSKDGQDVCGDMYITLETEEYLVVGIADGLGSGKEACHAATCAVEGLKEVHMHSVGDIINHCNQSLHQTRGAVLGVIKIYFAQEKIEYATLGNIQLIFLPEQGKVFRAIPRPGYLSGKPIQVREEAFEYEGHLKFIMHSDGFQLEPSRLHRIGNVKESKKAIDHLLPELSLMNDDLTVVFGEVYDTRIE